MESVALIVLDTQIVIWLNQEREKVSAVAVKAIERARREGTGVAISCITLWEFAMLASKGRIALFASLTAALQEIATLYEVLPITPNVADFSTRFSPNFPGDPADRIIAATAIAHRIPLVTADKLIRQSGEVPCIW